MLYGKFWNVISIVMKFIIIMTLLVKFEINMKLCTQICVMYTIYIV